LKVKSRDVKRRVNLQDIRRVVNTLGQETEEPPVLEDVARKKAIDTASKKVLSGCCGDL
jgi:hypothetical protein